MRVRKESESAACREFALKRVENRASRDPERGTMDSAERDREFAVSRRNGNVLLERRRIYSRRNRRAKRGVASTGAPPLPVRSARSSDFPAASDSADRADVPEVNGFIDVKRDIAGRCRRSKVIYLAAKRRNVLEFAGIDHDVQHVAAAARRNELTANSNGV
jgi:hypothetical protein